MAIQLEQADEALVGASFGLTVTTTDDGAALVTWVDPAGPAAVAGIDAGAQILSVGGE